MTDKLPVPSIITYKTTISDNRVVEFRPMLMKEQKILLMAQEEQDDGEREKAIMAALRQVIKSCLITDIKFDRMASFDMEWLLLQIRQKSVGTTIDVNIRHMPNEKEPRDCEPCNKQTKITIDLSKAKVNTNPDMKKVFEFGGGFGVEVTYPSIETLNRMREFNEAPKLIEILIEVIAACISRIFTKETVYDAADFSIDAIINWLYNFDYEVIEKIHEEFIMKMPFVSLDHTWKCSTCGLEETTTIRGVFDFFR